MSRAPCPQGRVTTFDVDGKHWRRRGETRNTTLADWGFIAARAIGFGDRNYRINAMYLEYENVASPGDPVSAPSFGVGDGAEYYAGLSTSPDRDFLRVATQGLPALDIETGYEAHFTEGETGNRLTFFAQSSGTQGYHGKSFSNASNSKVFGVALVAVPDWADQSQDVVFARAYLATSAQQVKEASSQIGMGWVVPFPLL